MMTLYKIFLTAMCSNLDVISFIQNECFQLSVVAADTTRDDDNIFNTTKTYKPTTQNTIGRRKKTRTHGSKS